MRSRADERAVGAARKWWPSSAARLLMTTPAFDKAAEISRNSKVKASTAELLRGYGFYKVATTGARAWSTPLARTKTSRML